MATQFSGGVAHKHHRNNKHYKHEDLNEAMSYFDNREDEDFEHAKLKT